MSRFTSPDRRHPPRYLAVVAEDGSKKQPAKMRQASAAPQLMYADERKETTPTSPVALPA